VGRIKSCLNLSMCPELDPVDKDAIFVMSNGTTSKPAKENLKFQLASSC